MINVFANVKSVNVDHSNGDISINNAIIFENNKYNIKNNRVNYLKNVWKMYGKGTYLYNISLAQKRASNIVFLVLSDNATVLTIV